MAGRVLGVWLLFAAGLFFAQPAVARDCVGCHEALHPGIIADWKASLHAQVGIKCSACHGKDHRTEKDVAEVKHPTPEVCARCHPDRAEEFKLGKHAIAWTAMKAMPTTHWKPMEMIEGQKGCGGCHKIGVKSDAELAQIREEGSAGGASCDSCHTRHLFSRKEARQPQACQTCHMGFDHPQWEMYSTSKHGVRYLLKQNGTLPEHVSAPTCQTCHMDEGNHEVRAPWGFLAVRLPLPEDPQWRADQITLLQGLGVLDPEGNPTERLDVVKAADVARLTQESFDEERNRMIAVCARCHTERFAKNEMDKGDKVIRAADHLVAEAIRIVAALYKDGVLAKPESYAYPFPDLLSFHDAPTPIEHRLFVMFLKHRMRTFQGAFHNNPDYTLWYGWSELQTDLIEIRHLGEALRKGG
ncbi:MAG: multiheme c-type cytochrome [Leptospirillia bacterium]